MRHYLFWFLSKYSHKIDVQKHKPFLILTDIVKLRFQNVPFALSSVMEKTTYFLILETTLPTTYLLNFVNLLGEKWYTIYLLNMCLFVFSEYKEG